MKIKTPYETLDIRVWEWACNEDIITSSILDNDGDYRDWDEAGDAW